MIRSVPYRIIKASMTPKAFSSLMSLKQSKDIELEHSVHSIVNRWKTGEITLVEKDSLEAPIYDAYNTWALSVGIYEDVSQDQIDSDEENNFSDIISSMSTTRMLNIVTKITNYYRSKQSKSQLTSAQVQTRLMS